MDWKAGLHLIPEHMQGAMERWIEHGMLPGSFLQAVLSNDLFDAVGRADDLNRRILPDYVVYLYSYAPSECFGSREKVQQWYIRGGLGEGQ